MPQARGAQREWGLDRGARALPAPASGALPPAQYFRVSRGVAPTPAPMMDSAGLPGDGDPVCGWVRLLVSPSACHLTPCAPKSWPTEPKGAPQKDQCVHFPRPEDLPCLHSCHWPQGSPNWSSVPSQPDGPQLEPRAPAGAPCPACGPGSLKPSRGTH